LSSNFGGEKLELMDGRVWLCGILILLFRWIDWVWDWSEYGEWCG